MLRPLLNPGDKIIHIDSGKEYKIDGDRASVQVGSETFVISLYNGHEEVEGFKTGSYKIVRKEEKSKKLTTTTEPPTKPDDPPKGPDTEEPKKPKDAKPTTTKNTKPSK